MEDKNLNNLGELNHLIHDHGFLKSFNVNRRVTQSEINKIARSMGMDSDKMNFEDINSIISTLSHIEYSCGEVPGTKNSSSKSLQQFKINYQKLNKLITYAFCVIDLLEGEHLTTNEKLFILNKCVVDIQKQSRD
jgi:hypothetical protein